MRFVETDLTRLVQHTESFGLEVRRDE